MTDRFTPEDLRVLAYEMARTADFIAKKGGPGLRDVIAGNRRIAAALKWAAGALEAAERADNRDFDKALVLIRKLSARLIACPSTNDDDLRLAKSARDWSRKAARPTRAIMRCGGHRFERDIGMNDSRERYCRVCGIAESAERTRLRSQQEPDR